MSEGIKRRERIIEILRMSKDPVSGTDLARMLHVSRQVIVQDVALLRAEHKEILSTYKGYLLPQEQEQRECIRVFRVHHKTEETQDELHIMVDHGGNVRDVFVEHPLYGQLRADLMVSNRLEVQQFVERMHANGAQPLKTLTDGSHYHTVSAPSEENLDLIEAKLRERHYLEL